MTDTDTQAQVFAEFAEVARTLGNTHRLILLGTSRSANAPLKGWRNFPVCRSPMPRSTYSNCDGLVLSKRRDGKRALYRLGGGPIDNLLTALRQYAEHNRSLIRELVGTRSVKAASSSPSRVRSC